MILFSFSEKLCLPLIEDIIPGMVYSKIFFIQKTIKDTLIIICKGIQKNHQFEKCTFLWDGNWEDKELVEHQKYHESLEDENYSWLGFDVSQSFGKFSGRDGKRT